MGSKNRGDEDAALDAASGINPYPSMLSLVCWRVVTREKKRDPVGLRDNIIRETM